MLANVRSALKKRHVVSARFVILGDLEAAEGAVGEGDFAADQQLRGAVGFVAAAGERAHGELGRC